jgi:hypothetical protein
MKVRLLAVPIAVAAALFAAGPVFAWPANSISVETNGCDYTIQVNQDHPNTFIGFEVRVFAASPMNGALVKSGSGTADATGHITFGPFTGEAGHYNALVDYGLPVGQWAEVVDFTLSCGTETSTTTSTTTETSSETSTTTTTTTETSTVTSTATSTETSTPTSTSTTTPTGAELGETGTPPATPTGQELGVVGTPGATPPPTDTASIIPAPMNDWRVVLIALAGLIGAISWLARIPATAAVRKRNR